MGYNVFADLGLENPEELLLQAGLAIEIRKVIESVGMSHASAAKEMGIKKKELIDLIDSPFHVPSGRLLALLNKLGQDVEIVVTPRATEQASAKVTVRGGREQAAA